MKTILLFFLCFVGQASLAKTIIVTNGNDAGPGSLRNALEEAQDGNIIEFSGVGEVTLISSFLTINESVTIKGNGIRLRANFSPIMNIAANATVRWERINFEVPSNSFTQLSLPRKAKVTFEACTGQWENNKPSKGTGTNNTFNVNELKVAPVGGGINFRLVDDPNSNNTEGDCGTFSTTPSGITGNTSICAGGSTTLTVSGGVAGTNAIAQWFAGSCASTVIGTGNTITVTPNNNTTYFVRYSGSCNTTSCASVTVTVSTPLAPTGALSITNSNCTSNCTLTSGSIAIGSVSGTGGTLQYSTNNGSTWSSALPTYNPNSPQTILASVLSSSGCRSASTQVGITNPGTCPVNTFFRDADGDGFGNPSVSIQACSAPAGFVSNNTDCDDNNTDINPTTVWYKDYDDDGYSDGITSIGCNRPIVAVNLPERNMGSQFDGFGIPAKLRSELKGGPNFVYDCDDSNPDIYPGAGTGCLVNCPSGSILYVKWDATGNNDGSNWANAFNNLQDALIQACPNITQIWVAKGTYFPDQGVVETNNDRNAAFVMRNNLEIYGGFAGIETSLSQRNWKTNVTTLSGDIDQNDEPDFNNNSGNSYHVVYNNGFSTKIEFIDFIAEENTIIIDNKFLLNNSAILDGFTVKAGNANGSDALTMNGGGMFNKSSHPYIRNVSFIENSSAFNGGAVSNQENVVNQENASPTFENCVFLRNRASGKGGGMYNYASIIDIKNSKFIRNSANSGGGIHNETNSNLFIVNSIFSNNSALVGGGLFNNFGDYPEAVFTFASCTNCSFSSNTPKDISNFDAEFRAVNSILNELEPNSSSTINITYSIIKREFSGTGNIFADPLYADPANDNLRILPGSPALNSGLDAANNEPFDLDGFARKVGIIDMGAYETGSEGCPQNIIYVDRNATGLNNGSSWTNAFTNLQDALGNQCPGITQIWVAKGTYYPDEGGGKTNNDRNASFVMKNDIAIYGGFAGTETSLDERNWSVNQTILSGDIDQNDDEVIAVSDLLTNTSRLNNSYHVVMNNFSSGTNLTTALLDGFIITGGNANGASFPNSSGGAIFNAFASPSIKNCAFIKNAANGGGAIYNQSSSAQIINTIFLNNYAQNVGGGINNFSVPSSLSITNCSFYGNAANTGGGIANVFSTPSITNCILWGNTGVLPSISDQSAVGTVSFSIVESRIGDYPGIGNLNVDPLFVSSITGNLRLRVGSPAINSGNDAATNELLDFDGNPRKLGVIDMGAYEFENSNQCTPVSVTSTTLDALQIEGCGTSSVEPITFAYSTIAVVLTQQQYESLNLSVVDGSCPISSVSYKDVINESLSSGGRWVIDRTFTVTDDNDAIATLTQQITVEDNIAPTVLTNNITTQIDVGGIAIITPEMVDNGSFDDCGIQTLSLSKTQFFCNNIGSNTVTLTATDANGNIASAIAIVTVEDKALPTVITKNLTVQLDETGNASITERAIDDGSFDACGLVSYETDKTIFNCSDVGENTVTLTVQDANGNISSSTATVTVLANQETVWYTDADGDGYGVGTGQEFCGNPGPGWALQAGDCDDTNSAINPDATEVCDGLDNNCNGQIDEGVATTFFLDADGDGFGNPSVSIQACSAPENYVTNNTDCDDSRADINPNTVWYEDADNDGFSNGNTLIQCLRPQGYKLSSELTATTGDCNDTNAGINPGSAEVCGNGNDDDCNPATSDVCALPDADGDGTPDADDCAPNDATKWRTATFFIDTDNDGYDDGQQEVCYGEEIPAGYKPSTLGPDCDDSDASITVPRTWYEDADNDGFSNGNTLIQCLRPQGYKLSSELTATTGDCDDTNAGINPGSAEVCGNGNDDDCNPATSDVCTLPDADGDGTPDADDCALNDATKWRTATFFIDTDNDGYDDGQQEVCYGEEIPAGYKSSTLGPDCDDSDAAVTVSNTWYQDEDNDGYSNGNTLTQCERPIGYKLEGELIATIGDCNDSDADINPNATEICDGIDNNCNGQTDEGFPDANNNGVADCVDPDNDKISFTLINAGTDLDIFTLTDGLQISQNQVQGLSLNIRANTNPSVVESVFITISGPVNRTITENVAPYALFGDRNGDYNGRNLPVGNYTIEATPYSQSNRRGTAGSTTTIQFSIVPVSVTGITTTPSTSSIIVGNTLQVTATVMPSNATNKAVVWSTSDQMVATVSASGLVTAISPGEATITATTLDGNFSATSQVSVIQPAPPITISSFTLINAGTNGAIMELTDGIQISQSQVQGLSLNIKANSNPSVVGSVFFRISGPVNRTVTENVAPYALFGDRNGNYNGGNLPVGNYTLEATPYSRSNRRGTAGSTTTIQFSIVPVSVTGITTTPSASSIIVGNTLQVTATVTPSNATNKAVVWSTSDQMVATVSASGLVTAISPGEATITAKTLDGNFSATSEVSVIQPAPPLTISSFTLINAGTNGAIMELTDGIQISQSQVQGLSLNIRANTNPSVVGSVFFRISGPVNRAVTENVAPYALFGDRNGNFNGGNLPVGNYTLEATPYSQSNRRGTKGSTLAIKFSITSDAYSIEGAQLKSVTSGNATENTAVIEKENQAGGIPKVIRMYPNPVSDLITLEFSGQVDEQVEVTIFDMRGVRLFNQEVESESNKLVLDISNLRMKQGMFVLLVNTNGYPQSFKFLKK